jgi:hypothetical protein
MIQNVFQEIFLPAEHEVFDEYIAPRRWLNFSYYLLQQRFTTAYFVIAEKGNGRVLPWLI